MEYFGEFRPISAHDLELAEVPRAQAEQRRLRALDGHLSPQDAAELALDDDYTTRSIAMNRPELSQESLRDALARFPEHEAQVAMQDNAPAYLLGLREVSVADAFTVERFIEYEMLSGPRLRAFRSAIDAIRSAGVDSRETLDSILARVTT